MVCLYVLIYIYVLILLYVCPLCVYVCPHTAMCVSSYCSICVLILLYMCPHTAIYVSAYCIYFLCAQKAEFAIPEARSMALAVAYADAC